jgi:primosomal protein N' (replication factor Y)
VDEEHDPSFKQESGLRYHGRDLAVVRGMQCGAVVVLGSATPSLESIHNVRRGRYRHLVLPERVDDRPMPQVELVDLRGRRRGKPEEGVSPSGLVSEELLAALRATCERGEQSIVFLNRRGHSTALLCRDCGDVRRCEACAVAFTWHERRRRLVCHHCGAREQAPETCPACGSVRLLLTGAGTEKIEDELASALPGARVVRLDRDSARNARQLSAILDRFTRREIDVLVGTQMVTKGHDFPGVTLVSVLLADAGLHQPDFRASERTAQLLTQVAGRAGRGKLPGRVLLQTFTPDAPAVDAVVRHDYAAFARGELAEREAVGYPPFRRLGLVRLEGEDEQAVQEAAAEVARTLRGAHDVELLGPAPAPLAYLRGHHRLQLLLKAPRHEAIRAALDRLAPLRLGGVRLALDVDPVDLS